MEDRETTNKLRYTIEHPNWPGCCVVAAYGGLRPGADGRIHGTLCRLDTTVPEGKWQFVKAVLMRLPVEVETEAFRLPAGLSRLSAEHCVVRDVTRRELTFAAFWDAYGYKVGNKATVERKWNALSDADRLLALGGIERQRRHSEQHRTDMPYPETYLNQRRWENVF